MRKWSSPIINFILPFYKCFHSVCVNVPGGKTFTPPSISVCQLQLLPHPLNFVHFCPSICCTQIYNLHLTFAALKRKKEGQPYTQAAYANAQQFLFMNWQLWHNWLPANSGTKGKGLQKINKIAATHKHRKSLSGNWSRGLAGGKKGRKN